MKKNFYKVRVVHDSVRERFIVQTKEGLFSPWNYCYNQFSYSKEYHQMYNVTSAEEAAIQYAEAISKQTIVKEF